MANKYLVIHGHFYQPPREDPWTGVVSRQPSASPFHDWNDRINHECYKSNTCSRILNSKNKIIDIVNNYEYLNFNIGPTLFAWLKENDPETVKKIIDADRKSMEKYKGHGNAIAQIYNHMIMPLSSTRDKITQVEWGLRYFKDNFDRDAEAIWLSETAVNLDTVRVLIDCGIKYIILSPTQAESVRRLDDDKWKNVSNSSINPKKAYYVYDYINGKRIDERRLAVFFYDGGLSSAIGFENLLVNADRFLNKIQSIFTNDDNVQLVSAATDGESYGHHTKYGDMCLADLFINKIPKTDIKIINYGYFLELYPPKHEVILKRGENGLGTAWSCAHGVGRWYRDCGCGGTEGGWNQQWRGPLRLAYDKLRDRLVGIFEEKISPLIKDIWKMRNEYIELIHDHSEDKIRGFIDRHKNRKLNESEIIEVLNLLEAQKYALYMYTSCGWFFAELSGIEPVQNMRYAYRVAAILDDLYGLNITVSLKEDLYLAKSNIPYFRDGKRIFELLVENNKFLEKGAAHQYILLDIFKFSYLEGIYHFSIRDYEIRNRGNIYYGRMKIKNNITLREKILGFVLLRKGLKIMNRIKNLSSLEEFPIWINKYLEHQREEDLEKELLKYHSLRLFGLKDIVFDARESILKMLLNDELREINYTYDKIFNDNRELISIIIETGLELPDELRIPARSTLENRLIVQLMTFEHEESDRSLLEIKNIYDYARKNKIGISDTMIIHILNAKIKFFALNFPDIMQNITGHIDILKRLERLIKFIIEMHFNIDTRDIQNIIFFIKTNFLKKMLYELENTQELNRDLFSKLIIFVNLAEMLNIDLNEEVQSIEKLKQKFIKNRKYWP